MPCGLDGRAGSDVRRSPIFLQRVLTAVTFVGNGTRDDGSLVSARAASLPSDRHHPVRVGAGPESLGQNPWGSGPSWICSLCAHSPLQRCRLSPERSRTGAGGAGVGRWLVPEWLPDGSQRSCSVSLSASSTLFGSKQVCAHSSRAEIGFLTAVPSLASYPAKGTGVPIVRAQGWFPKRVVLGTYSPGWVSEPSNPLPFLYPFPGEQVLT